jgi:hypothetical protein
VIGVSVNGRSRRLRGSLADALRHEALLSASLAGLVAAAVAWLGPPGGDFAAHAYQRSLLVDHGFVVWNNLWYLGRYDFVAYSVLYYPLAALLGIRLLAVLSVSVAALAFALVVGRRWGTAGRWPGRSFAILWAAATITGAFPFMLGVTFALLALLALQARARWWFAAFSVLSLASSPVALFLLAVVAAGVGLAQIEESRKEWKRLLFPASVLVVCIAAQLLAMRLFPREGKLGFSWLDLLAVLAFCIIGAVVAWRGPEARPLRWIFPVYLVVCVGSFLVPSSLGHDVTRLRFFAFPLALLLIALRGFRPRAVAGGVLALALAWNMSPLVLNYAKERSDAESSPSFWQPAVDYLHGHLDPSFRVEVVDTAGHWGAVYLPQAGIPIARGWFEQDDHPQNDALYRDLGRRSYLGWLRSVGVRYVLAPRIAADNSSRREAALISGGGSGLEAVFRSPDLTVYEVPDDRPIVTGPGRPRVLSLGYETVRLDLPKPGTYRVAERYSPYLQLGGGCVKKGADGLTEISVKRGGTYLLGFDFDLGRALGVLTGDAHNRCA